MECSVIVTAYNQANTIRQTLDSILSQKCNFKYEIIVGDDSSKDGTIDICIDYQNRYPEFVKPLFQKKNLGVGANFASCIKHATGKYIAVCAADDFWHNPEKLQMQVDYMEDNPDYGLLYTDYDKINISTGKLIKNYLKTTCKKTPEGNGLIRAFFNGQVPALTLTVMFKKELFDKYVPADDYIKYCFPLEDWPTWLILSKYTKIGYLPISTATYCFGHESISNPTSFEILEKRFAKEQEMYKYLCNMFPEESFYIEAEYLSYKYNVLLNLAYKKSNYLKAKKYAQKSTELGVKNFKVKMVRNRLTFNLFIFIVKIKNKLIG